MDLVPGLSIISPADADDVARAAAQEGCVLYRISTEGRSGREAFFHAVRNSLPLDPPIVSARSWDALSDSLWEGIYSMNLDRVIILWPDATLFAEESPDDFRIAIDVLTDVARLLSDTDATVGRPTAICAYVGKR